jgi:hypothetical protein
MENKQEDYRKVAEDLWYLLDDIYNFGSFINPLNEIDVKRFYEYIMNKADQKQRYFINQKHNRLYTEKEWEEHCNEQDRIRNILIDRISKCTYCNGEGCLPGPDQGESGGDCPICKGTGKT